MSVIEVQAQDQEMTDAVTREDVRVLIERCRQTNVATLGEAMALAVDAGVEGVEPEALRGWLEQAEIDVLDEMDGQHEAEASWSAAVARKSKLAESPAREGGTTDSLQLFLKEIGRVDL